MRCMQRFKFSRSRNVCILNSPFLWKHLFLFSNFGPTLPIVLPISVSPSLAEPCTQTRLAQLGRTSSDLAIIIADGLSALAVERNAIPVLAHLLPQLLATGWTIAPLALVEQGRVAIGDPIGFHLGASLSLVLIGERPGLSSPDSLGAYLTWNPHPDRTDADRNCLSNIRDGGLSPEAAGDRLFWYLQAARARQITGTSLKEGSIGLEPLAGVPRKNLL